MTRLWHRSWRADPAIVPLADRHYTRQSHGAQQFAPAGSCRVLRTADADAYWITSYPIARFVKHEWAGAWICSAYRNEKRGRRSSDLILEAIAVTRFLYGEPPALGMVTMVDPREVRPKPSPGRCFLEAGFAFVGTTKEAGHLVFQLRPDEMPAPLPPVGDVRPARLREPRRVA